MRFFPEDDRLRRADFLKMAATAGLSAGAADAAIEEMTDGLAQGLDAVSVPEVPGLSEDVIAKADQMFTLCRERLAGFS